MAETSFIFVPTVPGLNSYHTGSYITVLGPDPTGDYFNIWKWISTKIQTETGTCEGILSRNSVNYVAGLIGTASLYIQTRWIFYDPWLQLNGIFNPADWCCLDLWATDITWGGRFFYIKNRCLTHYYYFLIRSEDLLLQRIIKFCFFPGGDPYPGQKNSFKTYKGDLNIIFTRTNITDLIISIHICCCPERCSLNKDIYTGQWFIKLCINDCTLQSSRILPEGEHGC